MQVQSNTATNHLTPPDKAVGSTIPNSVTSPTVSANSVLTPPSAISQNPIANGSATKNEIKTSGESSSFAEKDFKVELSAKKLKKPVSKKQIPTVLGLFILFVALISGVLLFGQGTGVFAPRATAETTPKNIRISNITDKSFTISFYTEESTVAFVKYGETEGKLDKQASDDRDQLSGVVKDYRLHHITVRNLNPSTNYFYTLGTGSNTFDNDGQAYSLSTATKPSSSPSNNQTIYGNVLKADKTPAEGAIVYLYSEKMGTLSSLVKSSGSWGIALSTAFNTEKTNYALLEDSSALEVKVQGVEANLVSNLQTTVEMAQPVPDLILGQDNAAEGESATDSASLQVEDKAELLAAVEASSSEESSDSALENSSVSANLSADNGAVEEDSSQTGTVAESSLANETASTSSIIEDKTLDLSSLDESQEASATVLTTTQPQIKATLPANTMVRVVIHSDTTIDETVQTDANGNMVLDVESLGANLDPGEHTASYTYIDPVTGKEVTKTYNFTVNPTATRQLAAAADLNMRAQTTSTPTPTASPTKIPSIPYGSGNPYTPTATTTPTISASPSIASGAASSTRSAVVSTSSGQYNSGSVGTTIALLFGGLFFVLAGVWSYFLATSFEQKNNG